MGVGFRLMSSLEVWPLPLNAKVKIMQLCTTKDILLVGTDSDHHSAVLLLIVELDYLDRDCKYMYWLTSGNVV